MTNPDRVARLSRHAPTSHQAGDGAAPASPDHRGGPMNLRGHLAFDGPVVSYIENRN